MECGEGFRYDEEMSKKRIDSMSKSSEETKSSTLSQPCLEV
jgi:hypothetical protein